MWREKQTLWDVVSTLHGDKNEKKVSEAATGSILNKRCS